jgi:hypothetical protein
MAPQTVILRKHFTSFQVVEERGKGSYSHVSQTRDFSKKIPAPHRYGSAPSHPSYPSPHPYPPPPAHYAPTGPADYPHPTATPSPHYHLPPPPPHPTALSYLDPLPSPSTHYDDYLEHRVGHPHIAHHGTGGKPRNYSATGHHGYPGKKHKSKKGYGKASSHGVRSYSVL